MNYLAEFKNTPGWRVIFEERVRQTQNEGWTDEHDSRLPAGALLEAGKCYMDLNADPEVEPESWPFESHRWKPKSRQRNLVIAGALCLAEIDRTVRQYYRPVGLHALDDKFAESLQYIAYVATLAEECALRLDSLLRGRKTEL